MTLEKQLRDVQESCERPQIAGFESQRRMVQDLRDLGLLPEPSPPRVPDARLPAGQVRVRWRST